MASELELRLLQRADGDSWIDELLVLIDGRDRLATLGRTSGSWIGREPRDVLGSSSLTPQATPRDSFVARCDCGLEGCGALIARISRRGDEIVWDRFRRGSDATARTVDLVGDPIVFDAGQYAAALAGHQPASAWQPTTRRAARLAGERVACLDLSAQRLRGVDFGARGDEELSVKAFFGMKGDPDRAMLSGRFLLGADESAESLAERAARAIADGTFLADPNVEWKRLPPAGC